MLFILHHILNGKWTRIGCGDCQRGKAVFITGLDRAADYWRQNGGFDMLLITEKGEIRNA